MQQWNARVRVLGLMVMTVLLVAGCSSSGIQTSYEDPSVEENFRAGCELALEDANEVASIQEGADQVCSCAFTQIKESISFEDFVAVDERLREDVSLLQSSTLTPGSPEAQIVDIVSGCIRNS